MFIIPSIPFSEVLQVPEDRIKSTWDAELSATFTSGTSAIDIESSEGVSLRVLRSVAALHHNHRHKVWQLLQELIRIDMDGQHPMNAQAAIQVDKFLSR